MNCIPYFIISEHTDSYYFNGEYIQSKKFKNCIKEIHLSPRYAIVSLEFNPFVINDEIHDENPENSIEKFKENYSYLQELKKTNRTILIQWIILVVPLRIIFPFCKILLLNCFLFYQDLNKCLD